MSRKQQRIYAIGLVFLGFALATFLSLTALKQNITFFYSPSDILAPQAQFEAPERPFRLGGMVKDGSIEKHGTVTSFTVTDYTHEIHVHYDGIVPNLFAEGQGIVATGRLNDEGMFIAASLLAKHD